MPDWEVSRPSVSVIVPYYGDAAGAQAIAQQLEQLHTVAGDELLIADNTPSGVVAAALGPETPIRVIPAGTRASPYYARNVAATLASNDWLLFTDADCLLAADLLDAYFAEPVDGRCGALAGAIVGEAGQPGLIPAYIRSRRHLDQEAGLAHPFRPQAFTANLLVSRAAFEAVGGFCDGVRSGADTDFCWRLIGEGWTMGYRGDAVVEHHHRETFAALMRQTARDGAGTSWANRRFPAALTLPGPRDFGRSLLGLFAWVLLLQPRRALYKGIDGAFAAAYRLGGLADNTAADVPAQPPSGVVACASFPEKGVELAADPGVRVEARHRPMVVDLAAVQSTTVAYAEDSGALTRLRALLFVLGRRPKTVATVLRSGARRSAEGAPAARRIIERGDVEVRVQGPADTEYGALIAALSGVRYRIATR